MPRRFCYLVAALVFSIRCHVVSGEVFTLAGVHLYTLHFLWGNNQMTPLDATMSDTARIVRLEESLWDEQLPFYAFELPSSVAACTSFYLEVEAQSLNDEDRPAFIMRLFPLIVEDSVVFEYYHNEFWVQFSILDSVQFGELHTYRTYGEDSYIQLLLQRDHPHATHLVLGPKPSVDDTFRIINTTLVWNTDGTSADERPHILSEFALYQNYPNPFNAETTIEFSLPEQQEISLVLYDVNGRFVRTLLQGEQRSGSHAIKFNARDLPSGLYFYTLQSQTSSQTQKLLLLK